MWDYCRLRREWSTWLGTRSCRAWYPGGARINGKVDLGVDIFTGQCKVGMVARVWLPTSVKTLCLTWARDRMSTKLHMGEGNVHSASWVRVR